MAGAGLAVAVFLLVMAPRTADDGQRAETAKLQSLVPLGQWLHNYAPPRAAVALQDIGVVAYYSGLRVIDNNPGALTNGDLIYRAGAQGFADLTLDPQPEFLVFTSGSYVTPKFYQEFATLQQDPRFLTQATRSTARSNTGPTAATGSTSATTSPCLRRRAPPSRPATGKPGRSAVLCRPGLRPL